MSATEYAPKRGDIVEYQGTGKFIGEKQLGRVTEVVPTGLHARQLRVSWFNDTASFAWPRQVRFVARPTSMPETGASIDIDGETKTITGVLK